jgi:hypothetical protein
VHLDRGIDGVTGSVVEVCVTGARVDFYSTVLFQYCELTGCDNMVTDVVIFSVDSKFYPAGVGVLHKEVSNWYSDCCLGCHQLFCCGSGTA